MSYGYQETVPAGVPCVDTRAAARQGSITAGVVLIIIGAALMAAQFVPGLAWWTLWPALIILAGLVQMVTPGLRGWGLERLSEAFGTMFIGAVLLGCTTGYIGWGMWATALSFWPVLLVMAGLSMMGQATGQTWLRAIAPAVVWAAIGYAAAAEVIGLPAGFPLIDVVVTTIR